MGERVGEEEGEVTLSEWKKCMEGKRAEVEGGGHTCVRWNTIMYRVAQENSRITALPPI